MSNNPRTESPTELAADQNPLERSAQKQPQQTKDHEEEEDTVDVIDDLAPPFLVKTKTREEKESMRQQFRNQEANRHKKGTYHWIKVLHDKFTTSMLLDNRAATARDHLGNFLILFVYYNISKYKQTILANERTFLAWLRTSLSLITVGVGKKGKLIIV
jgi:hypothetical protein